MGGDIGGAIKGAAGAVAGAAGAVLSKAKDAAGAISSAAKAAAKVVCPVVKPMCPGACSAAITAFKAAGTVLAATYHIPLNCLSGALEKGCNGLCKAICGRRRLRARHHKRKLCDSPRCMAAPSKPANLGRRMITPLQMHKVDVCWPQVQELCPFRVPPGNNPQKQWCMDTISKCAGFHFTERDWPL